MAGRRRALIVANGEYDNAGLQRLKSPAADADALAEVLSDRTISDFDVQVIRNETAHVVQAKIEDLFAEGKPEDVLLVHFSCHGLKSDSGDLFFAARNTRPDRLGSTAVPAEFVQRCMRVSRSRSIVLLLDCCYGGAFGQGVAVRAAGDANVLDNFPGGGFGGRGRAVITASNSIEYAFEGDRLADDQLARPSVFTAALVEGLRTGEADRDEDGWIALGELYEYLFDRVRERNPKQTPSRDIEMQGELYLARSRRRRIRPSPIPGDLESAIGAENMFTRLGAVAELRRRLESTNLPVAVGAFEALKGMAETDTASVAEAAQDAMRRSVVQVDAEALRLSAPSGASAAAVLRLGGPPVARVARFEASHSWIRVTEIDGGAELSVSAGESGTRRGKVVVTGPTGDAVVAVEIETIPEEVRAKEPPAPEPADATEPGVHEVKSAMESLFRAVPDQAPAGPAPDEVLKSRWPAVDDALTDVRSGPQQAGSSERTPPMGIPVQAAPPRWPEPPANKRGAPVAAAFAGVLGLIGAVASAVMPMLLLSAAVIGAGGVCMLVPAARRQIGPGLLAGAACTQLWFIVAVVSIMAGGEDASTSVLAGFGSSLAVIAAAFCGLRVVVKDGGGLGLKAPSGPLDGLVIVLGVTGAIAAFIQAGQLNADYVTVPALGYIGAGVLLVIVPLVAISARPRLFGLMMLIGWIATEVFVVIVLFSGVREASPAPIVVVAVVLGLMAIAALVAIARRNQPIGRQS